MRRIKMGTDLCGGHDWIVSARFSGDGGTKPVEGVVAFVLHSQHRGGQAHGWGRRGQYKVLDEVPIFLGMRLVGLEALVCCQRRLLAPPWHSLRWQLLCTRHPRHASSPDPLLPAHPE